MDVLSSIDALDDLIVKHTHPSGVSTLRNRLSHIREQVEAKEILFGRLRNEKTVNENVASESLARLTRENQILQSENISLKAENEALLSGSKTNDEVSGLNADAVRMLGSLHSSGEATIEYLAHTLGLQAGMGEYLMGELRRMKLVVVSRSRPNGFGGSDTYYKILHGGRKYLVEHGLT